MDQIWLRPLGPQCLDAGLGYKETDVSLPMEGEPPHVLAQHQSGRHEELSEVQSINPFFLVLLELKARILQKVYGVLGVHVLSGEKKKELM